MKKGLLALVFILLLLVLAMGNMSISYTKEALTIWFEKLVPSMFLCMVLVRLLYEQGFFDMLGKPLRPLLQFLFHIDVSGFSLVLSSMLIGFPTGAVLFDEQVESNQLSLPAGKRLLYTCSFATPGFIVLTCGTLMFHSFSIGLKLLMIQWICGFIFLFLTRNTPIITQTTNIKLAPSFLSSLTHALLDTGKTLYLIGGYLMLFLTLSSILLQLLPWYLSLPFSIFAEFSSGVIIIHSQAWSITNQLIVMSMLLGFGGFCVHMQITGMVSHMEYRYHTYFIWRLAQMMVSGILAYMLFAK